MNITIENAGFSADQKLKTLIKERCEKLSKYYNRITDVTVYLKLESSGAVKDKSVELTVAVPQKVLVSKSEDKMFEIALDGAVTSMERQIKRYKEKQQSSH